MTEQAMEVSHEIMDGLSMTLGAEGLWLNFESGTKKASLNIGTIVQNSGPIIRGAVHGWIEKACKDSQSQSASKP